MKSGYTLVIILLLCAFAHGNSVASSRYEVQGGSAFQLATIDSGDTVFFDMSNVIVNGNQVQVPVLFSSDDPVYALDFSFRFNDSKLTYDTILPAPAGVAFLAFSFFNPNDSIVRFTSSNLVAMSPLTELVYIVFTMQPGQNLVAGDLNTLKGYLNGDRCTEIVIPPVSAGFEDQLPSLSLEVFPNPAVNYFTVGTDADIRLSLLDITGKEVMEGHFIEAGRKEIIDCSSLLAGHYLIRISDEKGHVASRRLVISR